MSEEKFGAEDIVAVNEGTKWIVRVRSLERKHPQKGQTKRRRECKTAKAME